MAWYKIHESDLHIEWNQHIILMLLFYSVSITSMLSFFFFGFAFLSLRGSSHRTSTYKILLLALPASDTSHRNVFGAFQKLLLLLTWYIIETFALHGACLLIWHAPSTMRDLLALHGACLLSTLLLRCLIYSHLQWVAISFLHGRSTSSHQASTNLPLLTTWHWTGRTAQ